MRHLIIGALLFTATGCLPPRVLVSEEIVGPRSVQYVLRLTKMPDHPYYDLSARVCDLDATGRRTRCRETLLLSDVAWRPAPRTFY